MYRFEAILDLFNSMDACYRFLVWFYQSARHSIREIISLGIVQYMYNNIEDIFNEKDTDSKRKKTFLFRQHVRCLSQCSASARASEVAVTYHAFYRVFEATCTDYLLSADDPEAVFLDFLMTLVILLFTDNNLSNRYNYTLCL